MDEDKLRAILLTIFSQGMTIEEINKLPDSYIDKVDDVINKAVNLYIELKNDTYRS